MRTTATAPITHLCPYRDERDHGTITMTWEGEAPELHALRAYLDGYADRAGTHEDITRWIGEDYPDATVTTSWTTAGIAVEVIA